MTPTPQQVALWTSQVIHDCLVEAGDDVVAGFAAAEYILAIQQLLEGFSLAADAMDNNQSGSDPSTVSSTSSNIRTPAETKHRDRVLKESAQAGNRLEVLGEAGKQVHIDPIASASDEYIDRLWASNKPLDIPHGGDPEVHRRVSAAWESVSKLWPKAAGQLKSIRMATNEEAKIPQMKTATVSLNRNTGELVIPHHTTQIPPEILWHELVHHEQLIRGDLNKAPHYDQHGMTDHGRMMESEAHQRGNMQASETFNRLLGRLNTKEQQQSVGGWTGLSVDSIAVANTFDFVIPLSENNDEGRRCNTGGNGQHTISRTGRKGPVDAVLQNSKQPGTAQAGREVLGGIPRGGRARLSAHRQDGVPGARTGDGSGDRDPGHRRGGDAKAITRVGTEGHRGLPRTGADGLPARPDHARARGAALGVGGGARQLAGGADISAGGDGGGFVYADADLLNLEDPSQFINATLAIRHAPAGYTKERPLVIGGVPFVGGEFIPDETWAQATPEEKAAVTKEKKAPRKTSKKLPRVYKDDIHVDKDKDERLNLISAILVLLFGDQSVEVAKKLKANNDTQIADNVGMAFGYDSHGNYHGPTPPPGTNPSDWRQVGTGPLGGKIWKHISQASAPGGVPPPSTGQGQHVTSHQYRLIQATSAYHSTIGIISSGQSLNAQQASNLSKSLSVMDKSQLRSLYAALGGTAAIVGSQRQPWVHAIKAILLGQPVPTRQPAQTAAKGPKSAQSTRTGWYQPVASTIPYQDETTWETGKAQPGTLHGIDFSPAPSKFWEKTKDVDINEPPPVSGKKVDRVSVMIQEPDGRVWIVTPTNEYGNRKHTLPGGTVEPGLTNQQNALKEVWEETGLQVEITGHLGDFEDSNNSRNGRLYIGKRIGGAPWDAKVENHIINQKTGKPDAESDSVKLVTPERAASLLHRTDDLGQLMTVNPIKLDNPVGGKGSEPLKKFLKGIESARKAYEDKNTAAGLMTGNGYLHVVQNMRGYNAKPNVVSKKDMDDLIGRGQHIEVLRGLKSAGGVKAQDLAEQFRSGEHYPGYGVYGSGTYSDSKKGNLNQAPSYAYSWSGKDGAMIRIAIPKTAKIVKASELNKKVPKNPDLFTGYADGKAPEQCWRGVQAALAGYDAIYVDKSTGGSVDVGYYIILNRGILTVQEEDATGHLIK